MAPVIIRLFGSATIARPAERAVIALEVSSTADTNATACSKVTKTAEEVQAILETFSPAESSAKSNGNVALTHWSMASLQTTSYVSRPRNRNSQLPNRKLIFEASVTFNIRVRNFDKLGMLATELCQMRLVKIKKISWMLTDNTVATSQVELRKMAVADALQKAKEYAAALDLYKVTPSELVEQQDSICPVNATVTAYNGGGTGREAAYCYRPRWMDVLLLRSKKDDLKYQDRRATRAREPLGQENH